MIIILLQSKRFSKCKCYSFDLERKVSSMQVFQFLRERYSGYREPKNTIVTLHDKSLMKDLLEGKTLVGQVPQLRQDTAEIWAEDTDFIRLLGVWSSTEWGFLGSALVEFHFLSLDFFFYGVELGYLLLEGLALRVFCGYNLVVGGPLGQGMATYRLWITYTLDMQIFLSK